MKKNIFAIVIMGMMLLPICATTTIGETDSYKKDNVIFQGFEDGLMPPVNWSVINTHTEFNWWIVDGNDPNNTEFVHSGRYAAWVNYDYDLPAEYQDEWLISPDINLSDYVEVSLTFWAYSDTVYPTATMELHIRGDGFDDVIWNMTNDETWNESIYREKTFDLSSYIGNIINISWRYFGTDGQSFGLDDILISLTTTTEETNIYINNELPANNSMGINISQPTVSVYISATHVVTYGSMSAMTFIPFNWTIEGQYVQAAGADNATKGTKTANLNTPLPYSTQIVWYVNVTANGVKENKVFYFTTQSPPNQPTVFGTPEPISGSIDQPRALNWSIPINDPEGDTFNWTIQCSNGQQIGAIDATNGTKLLSLSSLDYLTTYYVRVNATDRGNGSTIRAIYNFKTLENKKPIVNFTYVVQDNNVSFDSSSSYDPEGEPIANWTWDFNDGNISYKQNPTHLYEDGIYHVTLTIRDEAGATNSTMKTVNAINNDPVARFTPTVDGKNVRLDASSSSDLNGTIVKYFWEFGDGTNGTGKIVDPHTYEKDSRIYKVNLTVTDSAGAINITSQDITIKDATKPTIKIDKPLRALYIKDKFVRRLFIRPALIIGDITISINASDSGSGIQYVQLWIGKNLTVNNTNGLFNYTWKRDRLRLIHLFQIKVVAYDKEGNSATKTMTVKKYL
ncbi:MAG: PKD domain-containing protein [Euryarchaeota archaeon]|nr:PKD domain-containing protein [Euryarchaeota archaeon]